MRREGTSAGQSIILTCTSAPGSTFEFTFRPPLRKFNTFPPLMAHSKVFSNNVAISNTIYNHHTFDKAFSISNKENKPAPFVFGAPISPTSSFSLSPVKQDRGNLNRNAADFTQKSNIISTSLEGNRFVSPNYLMTPSAHTQTRISSTTTQSSEGELDVTNPSPEHHVNEVVFSISSASTFFKKEIKQSTTNIPVKSSDDCNTRQTTSAVDVLVSTNILEDKVDPGSYTTIIYAGTKRKEIGGGDDLDCNISKRRRRNWERPQDLLPGSNISLTATDQKENNATLDKQIIASRSYDEEDLEALLVAQNTRATMSQAVSQQKLKESSVVVIRSIRTVDDLFEELENDANAISDIEELDAGEDDNGSELVYVHREKKIKTGAKIIDIPWAAGDSSDEDEIQVLRSMPRVLFPKPPKDMSRLDPKDFDSDYIFI